MAGPSTTTIKLLFALSGNHCAFPGCTNPLFDKNGALIANVCHIAGDKPGAKRYDPLQTEEQRQGFNNPIVLCANHHRVIDVDEVTYTRPQLRKMKQSHEARATEEYLISDRQAERIAVFLGGAVTGTALSEIAREVADVVRIMKDALPKAGLGPEVKRGPPEVVDALRYAPTGAFQALGTDEPHRRLGEFLVEVLKAAGWRRAETTKLELRPPPQPMLFLLFVLRDQHQVSNAKKAISELFDRCGFESDGSGSVRKYSEGNLLRFGLVVTSKP